MQDVLRSFPGAQRALFRKYHIGGCSSCGFQPGETLDELCRRNNNLDPIVVLADIKKSHEDDLRLLIEPALLSGWMKEGATTRLVDIRSREEFETASIPGSLCLSQAVMHEMMGHWPREGRVVIIDHVGKGALDAAAYFAGHGFTSIFGLRGGIDAWAREVDSRVPRYEVHY